MHCCTKLFVNMDMQYFIFKYKKNWLGKWLLGVSGGYSLDGKEYGGHTFSEMRPYRRKTEETDARALVEMVINYWKQQAKQYRKED